MSDTIGKINPIRYRGYYYDTEMGLYNLQSRYYDPMTGRFINADGFVSTGQDVTGYNMFAYCDNNPIMRVDSTGAFWKEIWDWAVDIYERNVSIQQQRALDTQIRLEQINGAKNGLEYADNFAESLWDAHVLSVELEAERQYQQDMAIIDTWEYFSDNPLIAVDAATGAIGLGSTVVGIAATAGIVSIPIAGQVAIGVVGAACGVWGLGRVFVTVWEDLWGGA